MMKEEILEAVRSWTFVWAQLLWTDATCKLIRGGWFFIHSSKLKCRTASCNQRRA